VGSDGDGQSVRVAKADARRPEITGRTAELRHTKGRLRVAAHVPGGAKPAELLRRRRQARGMSQAELARRIGITASALSQAEHDRRGLSEATLSRTWRVLGFDSADSIEQPPRGYVLARRGDRHLSSLATGLAADKIMERPSGFQAEVLSFGPGASGRRPPFATKWPEFVIVNEGVLELRVGEAREVLHAGDAMLVTGQPLTGWRNPSSTVTRALWVVFAGSG
jgi:transcriptional regulator with XRE-family HTH domain